MKRSAPNRADLLHALYEAKLPQESLTELLAYQYQRKNTDKASQPDATQAGGRLSKESDDAGPSGQPSAQPQERLHFWQPLSTQFKNADTPQKEVPTLSMPQRPPEQAGDEALPYQPLAVFADVLARVRRAFEGRHYGKRLDTAKIVDRLGRARPLHRLPRLKHRRWSGRLIVLEDRSAHLAPYAIDQALLVQALAKLYPAGQLRSAIYSEVYWQPCEIDAKGRASALRLQSGDELLLLSDLGALAASAGGRSIWQALARQVEQQVVNAVVLMPCEAQQCPADLRKAFKAISWEPPSATAAQELGQALESLLNQLALTPYVNAALLRRMRRSLKLPAALESLAWQRLRGGRSVSALGDAQLKTRRKALAEQSKKQPETHTQVEHSLALIRRHLRAQPYEIWLESVLNNAEFWPQSFSECEKQQAEQLLHYLQQRAEQGLPAHSKAWLQGLSERSADSLQQNPELQALLWRIRSALSGHAPSNRPQQLQLSHHADGWQLAAPQSTTASPMALINSRDRRFELYETYTEEAVPLYDWVSNQGRDQYGRWFEFQLAGVRQRLRWIPPGQFLMGSSEDEEGRFSEEGPQQDITIKQGFWLFDTPVTQALWLAVMGNNPSRFKGEQRPVEWVSFENAQQFIAAINQQLPGLDLSLPSEAYWEYACRAGTQGTLYADAELDDLAWYHENSGSETQIVGQKQANPWGLHDMLGNVEEWTQDAWQANHADAAGDGSARTGAAAASRVVRGGSWDFYARNVRCAFRSDRHPGGRFDLLGFRCARVQAELRPGADGAAPAEQALSRLTQGVLSAQGDSLTLNPTTPAPQEILLRSDQQDLTLLRIHLGMAEFLWADAIGRDAHGLWCEFHIKQVVQRLRWIPPGRFLMGSPEDEPGRRDNEGPQQEITIAQGFWLFDTPVTQALWQAVMGNNPSEFASEQRPVEQMSFEEVQQFIADINEQLPGLDLSLPSEAYWEYACRAGTDTALYTGPIDTLGEHNAPALDAIAWYGGNSGEGFELENGYDTSDWEEQQYPNNKAGTRPVKQKQANPWGLYDMLGNVFEWTQDAWQDSHQGAAGDGSARQSIEADAPRVVRGGSWVGHARGVRCAFRGRLPPGDRFVYLGFRCARVQGEQVADGTALARQAPRRAGAARAGKTI